MATDGASTRAWGYLLRREGEQGAGRVVLQHSLLSPAGLKSVVALIAVSAMTVLCATVTFDRWTEGAPWALAHGLVAFLLVAATLSVQVPKRLMLIFGSQSLVWHAGELVFRQDCVILTRCRRIQFVGPPEVRSADRGWFRTHLEDSLWPKPGIMGALSVRDAGGEEVARFGIGLSRRAAERLVTQPPGAHSLPNPGPEASS